MRILGFTEKGRDAQKVVRGDPLFADVVAVEENDSLILYSLVVPEGTAPWQGVYTQWAKIEPLQGERDKYRLAHLALNGQWQELDVEGSLEHCVRAIADNKYHLFFC